MDWALFWTALSAIGTIAASVIALFQPLLMYRIKIIGSARIDMCVFGIEDNENPTSIIEISIINRSKINAYIHNVALCIDKQYYFPTPTGLAAILNQKTLPYELKIGEKYQEYMSLEALKKELIANNADKSAEANVVVSDSYGHVHMFKTKLTAKDILEKGPQE